METIADVPEKTCPLCAEQIKRAALRCKHCGAVQATPPERAFTLSRTEGAVVLVAFFVALIVYLAWPASSPPVEQATEYSVAKENKPVMVAAGVDIVPELQKAGAPWDVDPFFDRESYTGGSVDLSRRTVSFPMGSIAIDRADRGGIHMVIVGSGMGDRCGDPAALGRAYAALAGPLEIPLPDEKQLADLQATWMAGKGMTEINFPHVLVRASGGCVSHLLIKALR